MEQPTKRLQSIDALRGFDMFWIMGGPWIIASLHGYFRRARFGVVECSNGTCPLGRVSFYGFDISTLFVYSRGLFPFFVGQTT